MKSNRYWVELRAGVTSFLTCVYIIVVIPSLFSATGAPPRCGDDLHHCGILYWRSWYGPVRQCAFLPGTGSGDECLLHVHDGGGDGHPLGSGVGIGTLVGVVA